VPSFSAADLDFGTVPIGNPTTDSITVSNAGYGALATMTISAVLRRLQHLLLQIHRQLLWRVAHR
jgi:hypothetical protein